MPGTLKTIRQTIWATVSVVAQALLLPFNAAAWIGNKITNRGFASLDKTAFGRYLHARCYRIGGPIFVIGDTGYIGYALEQGSHLQLSGALSTIPAHIIMALIGDERPLILDLVDKLKPSSGAGINAVSKLRAAATFFVQKDHYIIPAVFVLFSYNGFSMAASAVTRPFNTAIAHFTQHIAALTHSQAFMQSMDAITKTPVFANVVDILVRAPEFMQGTAICLGCLCLACNQYLNRTNAKAVNRSNRRRAAVAVCAEHFGKFAVGILSSSMLLLIATGIVDLSPSLLLCSMPAFSLGLYCQHKMRLGKVPVSAHAS